jgi:hypothetical protein
MPPPITDAALQMPSQSGVSFSKGTNLVLAEIAEVCTYEAARIHGVSNLKTCS